MKKGYNFLHNVTTNIVADIGFKNDCSNRYIQLGESTVSFGWTKIWFIIQDIFLMQKMILIKELLV